jgi:hypothetical protein
MTPVPMPLRHLHFSWNVNVKVREAMKPLTHGASPWRGSLVAARIRHAAGALALGGNAHEAVEWPRADIADVREARRTVEAREAPGVALSICPRVVGRGIALGIARRTIGRIETSCFQRSPGVAAGGGSGAGSGAGAGGGSGA